MAKPKKIKAKDKSKYSGYRPFLSDDYINSFATEESLLKRLKKYKKKSVYMKLPTGYWVALIKE